ncbi:sugar ABC transporter ATP-binding protein [Prosthecomicrobium pneumaticum]|uniref:ABC-type sugar transport system ATPase subunit n=1 Tax=Prosthecomicrobium pneumaticum TaxID=81895 RepID=A0A7W9CTK5_9HYPH|nr:sugar ABC transporter ATP-binding protein [Prosthecomicrobium pneumaticum]MBB5751655.1 ABC-type sugar transport system ATPase subunit [Prosthecomicrobium pneumaticum]
MAMLASPLPSDGAAPARLAVSGVSKSFGSNLVLRDVSFSVRAGEVVSLVGENGAGKSTLMHVCAGTFPPDGGTLTLDGAAYRPASPQAARTAGVALALQETAILPDLTVAENLLFGAEPRGLLGLIDQRRLHRDAETVLAGLGFALRSDRLGADLSAAERQMLEIAKAIRLAPRLLILDEPTASLSSHETELVLKAMARLTAAGGSVIFISHRLDEVMEAADHAVVLKDGTLTLDAPRGGFDRDDLIRAMVGRTLTDIFPARPATLADRPVRLALDAAVAPGLKPLTLDVRAGEIVGFAGLEGQGQRPLARALSGIAPFTGGTIAVDGAAVPVRSVSRGIAAGIASIPDDRKHEGLALDLPVRMNVSLFALSARSRWGWLRQNLERTFAEEARRRFAIRSTGIEQPVRQLSGGNQQKVVFARWLAETPKVLVLYEPTKGVDVGAKTEIYRLVGELSAQGVAVVLISADMLELIGLSDRIHVLFEGAVTGTLERADFSEEAIMRLAAGPEGAAVHAA